MDNTQVATSARGIPSGESIRRSVGYNGDATFLYRRKLSPNAVEKPVCLPCFWKELERDQFILIVAHAHFFHVAELAQAGS